MCSLRCWDLRSRGRRNVESQNNGSDADEGNIEFTLLRIAHLRVDALVEKRLSSATFWGKKCVCEASSWFVDDSHMNLKSSISWNQAAAFIWGVSVQLIVFSDIPLKRPSLFAPWKIQISAFSSGIHDAPFCLRKPKYWVSETKPNRRILQGKKSGVNRPLLRCEAWLSDAMGRQPPDYIERTSIITFQKQWTAALKAELLAIYTGICRTTWTWIMQLPLGLSSTACEYRRSGSTSSIYLDRPSLHSTGPTGQLFTGGWDALHVSFFLWRSCLCVIFVLGGTTFGG